MKPGSISLVWGDGEHIFRLAIGQLRELQEKTSTGPAELLRRITSGTWRVDDVRETLRLGLIGGGMPPANAHILVTRYVDEYEMPLLAHMPTVMRIIGVALTGPEELPGKRAAAKKSKKSPSPPSMAQAL